MWRDEEVIELSGTQVVILISTPYTELLPLLLAPDIALVPNKKLITSTKSYCNNIISCTNLVLCGDIAQLGEQ